MPQAPGRRRMPILVLISFLALSGGVAAIALNPIDLGTRFLSPALEFNLSFGETNTGFKLFSPDGSLLRLSGSSAFDPDQGLGPNETVQEGFVLLDGTLSLEVAALKDSDLTRARFRSTYRLNVKRRFLPRDLGARERPAARERLARRLRNQHVVRSTDPLDEVKARAGAMGLRDARVMRKIVLRDRTRQWVPAVSVLGRPTRVQFKRGTPDNVLGHFGIDRGVDGEPYVWTVMDRNSKYAVGLTVDRDGDGIANFRDNCIGTANSNQNDNEADGLGDACDVDDDNDSVMDTADNCPTTANQGQHDADGDGIGDVCDADDDNDNVIDGKDTCAATAFGEKVDANGCSIADLCPCDGEWRNHGAYVKCVAQATNAFLSAGLITAVQKDAIVSAGAQSSCGF